MYVGMWLRDVYKEKERREKQNKHKQDRASPPKTMKRGKAREPTCVCVCGQTYLGRAVEGIDGEEVWRGVN